MRTLTMAVAALCAAICVAEGEKPIEGKSAESKAASRIARVGGLVVRPDSFTGKVSIVNRQKRLPASDCAAVAGMLAELTQCNIVSDDGEGATIKLQVIDDPNEPVLLIAPEDRWGRVNVAKLVDGLPGERAKEKFFAPRARKMIIKGLSLLMGGGSSQFPGNVMNTATVRDLDVCQESVPVDMVDNYITYLKAVGVKPAVRTTYRKACREGWAPAPTNEVQKAIWDQIRQIPTKPIKIEFDPAKGK